VKERTALSREEWYEKVDSGFQILPLHLLGRVKGHDGTLGGVMEGQGIPGECFFDFSIDPVAGWGDTDSKQRSTAGWLSNFAVFEPHWQVTLADARATGTVVWKNKTYSFENEPFYAEKNWGKALPQKWYWTQCNSFDGYTERGNELAVTAGGGIRKVPFGQEESLGMVSVHYKGKFYEAVPWTGTMGWKVDTWGSWVLYGKCTEGDRKFEVEVTYHVDPEETPGLVFRAPTPKDGMVYFCRDTFEADVTLTLWELEFDEIKKEWIRKAGPPLIDCAKSSQGGAEVGGGPWWDTWQNDSRLKRSFKFMLSLPYKMRQTFRRKSAETPQ
jgi:tocopherol cyclase